MKLIVLTLAFAALATSLPNNITPEEDFATPSSSVEFAESSSSMELATPASSMELATPASSVGSEYDAATEARNSVDMLIQEGKDEGACADLAAATISEVENAVNTQQKILGSLDTGSDCGSKGQAAVDTAQQAVTDANDAKATADAAQSAAMNAPVTFQPKNLGSLQEGQCGTFFSDPAYVKAVAAKNQAIQAANQAAGAAQAAQTALDNAKAAQAELIKQCQCDVREAYNKAWEAANAQNDENQKAYLKGKHMKCVLEGTAVDECDAGSAPVVQAVTLADGVPAEACVVPTPSPTPVPTPSPTPVPTAPAPAPPQGDWTNANQCNKDSKGCCKGWPNYDNRFSHKNRKESQELNMADCMAKGIKEGGHTMIAFGGPVNGDGNKHRCDWWPSAPVGAWTEAVTKGTCCHSWTICPINQ
jgi:hypothetical protein